MTLRITPKLSLRRVATQLIVTVENGNFSISTELTRGQALWAAEAFEMMAAIMTPAHEWDDTPSDVADSRADAEYQAVKEEGL